jgi:hypothetical protein
MQLEEQPVEQKALPPVHFRTADKPVHLQFEHRICYKTSAIPLSLSRIRSK